MRFAKLTLEKYGAFDCRTLTIPPGPGLTVVYGPNEAGKSTCLAAIGDFLFGVPHNSVHGGVFGYDGMRLSATLTTAAGDHVALSRRKGRGKTLVNGAGEGVDDAALQALLGSTTRERFQTLFGLDHNGLRIGGEQLFAADGEIGCLIIEAGGGLRSLMSRLDQISSEADSLFSNRRNQNVTFYKLLDAFDDAERSVKAGSLTREAYEHAQKAHEAALAALAALRSQKQGLAEQISSLKRLVRVVPSLNELARIEAEIADLPDAPELPTDFDQQVTEAIRGRATAIADVKTTESEVVELEERLDGLVLDEAIIRAEARFRDIDKSATHIAKAREDRPGRDQELSESRSKLVTLKQTLNVASDDELAAKLPPQDALETVQRLANEAMARGPALASLRKHVEQLRRKVGAGKGKLEAARGEGHDRPFGISATDLVTLPGQAADLETKRRHADTTRNQLDEAVKALGFGSLESLTRLSCPSLPSLEEEIKARGGVEEDVLRLRETLQVAIAARDAAKAQIERLSAGEAIPTDVVMAEVRAARESAWAPVRTDYLDGTPPQSREARREAVNKIDQTITSVDRLADRRAAEAERIASLNLAEEKLAEALQTIAASEAGLKEFNDALAARVAEFDRSFPDLSALFPALATAKTFLERRGAIEGMAEAAESALTDFQDLEARMAPGIDLLIEAETRVRIAAPEGQSLAVRVRVATQSITVHDEAHAEYRRDLNDQKTIEESLVTLESELGQVEKKEATWAVAWPAAVGAIGLPSNVEPEPAAGVVTEWATARGILGMIEQTQRRLFRMDEDEGALGSAVAELGSQLGVGLPIDPLAAAEMLQSIWTATDKIRQQRLALSPQLDTLKARVNTRTEARTAAENVVSALALKAGVEDNDDALKAAATLFQRRADLVTERTEMVRLISSAGDGLAVDVLRQAWVDRTIDVLRAELAAAEDEVTRVDGEIEEAIQTVQNAAMTLAGFEASSGVNQAMAAREAAIAEMHRTIERYVELSLAHEAITRAIARIRSEQQDPLIKRAAQLFSLTTRGEFPGIDTDIDDKGRPVVRGRRASGGQVSVSAMSDGVRDQLFLAFRLASVEAYCQATEPLPFVADDILVHFDDPRSAASLDLLAEFGQTTQVLLFTHHLSVRDAAERLGNRAQIVELQ